MTKISDSFDITINLIETTITDQANNKFEEIKKQKETKLIDQSLISKRKLLEVEEKKLNTKLEDNKDKQDNIKRLIEKSECKTPWKKLNRTTQEVMSKLKDMSHYSYHSGATIVEIATSEDLVKTIEYHNFTQVKKLTRDVKNIFGLACGLKEQRNVILKLQDVDWKALDIDLPYLDFMHKDFKLKINKGRIVTTAPVLLEGPK